MIFFLENTLENTTITFSFYFIRTHHRRWMHLCRGVNEHIPDDASPCRGQLLRVLLGHEVEVVPVGVDGAAGRLDLAPPLGCLEDAAAAQAGKGREDVALEPELLGVACVARKG